MSLDEKTEVLETVIRIECRYLGMRDSAPALEIAYLEEGLLGQYNSERDVVFRIFMLLILRQVDTQLFKFFVMNFITDISTIK